MIKIIRYLTILIALLLASCSADDVTAPAAVDGGAADGVSYMAGFTITLNTADDEAGRALRDAVSHIPALSRTPATGDYEAGTMPENYIDLDGKDFKIYFFDKDDRYIAALNDVLVTVESTDGTMKRYRVNGTVPAKSIDDAGKEFKVMVLANWKHNYPTLTPGVSTIDNVASSAASGYTFDFVNGQKVGKSNPIPMFGVSNICSGLQFFPGWNTDLGTIHLLRAYAKIRVRAAADGLSIASVRLTRGNAAGLRAPMGVTSQDDYVHGAYSLDYYRIPSVPVEPDMTVDIPFIENNGVWILYVPEFANLNIGADGLPDPCNPLDEDTRSRIAVDFNGHVVTEYVDFKYYDTPPAYSGAAKDDYFDLLRNTVYDFTLRKLVGEVDLNVQIDVQPYTEQLLSPVFGLERDEDGNIMVRDNNGKLIAIIDATTNEQMSVDSEFKVEQLGWSGTAVKGEDGNNKFVYLDDGRLLIYTYKRGQFLKDKTDLTDFENVTADDKPKFVRWEIYSDPNKSEGQKYVNEMFLEEEYEEYRYNWTDGKFYPTNLHSYYDDGGTLIQRDGYSSKDSFDKGEARITTPTRFCGNRFGDKLVIYSVSNVDKQWIRITKKFEQATDNYDEPAYEIDYYEIDDKGEYLIDEHGRRKPVYKYDEDGNKIPIYTYKYHEDYLDDAPDNIPPVHVLPDKK